MGVLNLFLINKNLILFVLSLIALISKLLSYSNHLGLFSEDLDFETKRMPGNFPQAFSHLALIETAITISKGEITDEEQMIDNLQ